LGLLIGVVAFSGLSNSVNAKNATMNENMSMKSNVINSGTSMQNMSTTSTQNPNMNTNANMSMTNMHKILSPLQQFKSGVSAKSVQCNQGFTLVIKIDDGSPACVSSQTAQALTARGWGTTP